MTTPTVQFTADFSDQTALFDPAKFAERITVVGTGGIGGSVLPTLVTMGFRKYRLIDGDTVEPRNVGGGQLFRPSDMYKLKVEVAQRYLLDYGATDVEVVRRKFRPSDNYLLTSVVVSGVDSMEARQMLWPVVRDNGGVQLYLDGRIGGQQYELYVVEPFDGEWYESGYLPDDNDVAQLPCAARNIVFVSVGLGAEMGAVLAKFSRGAELPRFIVRHYGGDGKYFVVVQPPKETD